MELLIRVRTRPGQENDIMALKGGDVVTFKEDGWQWTEREQVNPDWRILKSTHLLPSEAEALTSGPEVLGNEEIELDATFPPRRLKFNLQHAGLTGPIRSYLDDDTRVSRTYNVDLIDYQRLLDAVEFRGQINGN